MKGYMNAHTENECNYMFTRAAEHVTNILTSMCQEVEIQMVCQVDAVLECMQRDYRSVLAGGPEDKAHTESLKNLRQEVMRILKEADGRFAIGEAVEEERRNEDNDNDDPKKSDKFATCGEALDESDTGAGEDAGSGRHNIDDSAGWTIAGEEKTTNMPAASNDDGVNGSKFYNAHPFPITALETAKPEMLGAEDIAESENGNNVEEYDVCWADPMPHPYEEYAGCFEEGYCDEEDEAC